MASGLPLDGASTYRHALDGLCRCGVAHGLAPTPERLEPDRGPLTARDFSRCVAPYPCDYRDEHGRVLYRVARWLDGRGGKSYAYYHPDKGAGWLAGRGTGQRVPYRLPELRQGIARGECVHICEGEKNVHALLDLGVVATTNDGGAGKWRPEDSAGLEGAREVVIWADNDDPGRTHAEDIARSLHAVDVQDLRIVHFPELPMHGDVADWIQNLGELDGASKRDAVLKRAATATQWVPNRSTAPQLDKRSPPPGRRNPWAAIQSAAQFILSPDPHEDFLEPRMLARGSLTLLFSPRGIGKTLYAHAVAVKQARMGSRVLLIDRDNSRRELKRRLRGWGAGDVESLSILGRDDAPALTDRDAWLRFPLAEYDLVLIDALDSSTEGVGEQDSARPSLALAPLLDIAHTAAGPAVLILGNTIKSGSHGRGSGVVEDRADIVYEVRDVTDMRPTGTKAWWLELPPADRGSWADRAGRRKKRDSYRLAFAPTKFRIGEEPEPFVYEIRLSTDPWACDEVTDQLIGASEEALANATCERAKRRQEAAAALAAKVWERAAKGQPMHERDDAVPFLMELGLSRSDARNLIAESAAGRWRMGGNSRRGDPRVLLPPDAVGPASSAAEISGHAGSHQLRLGSLSILADEESCGRPESVPVVDAPAAGANGAARRPNSTDPGLNAAASEVAAIEPACPRCGGRVIRWEVGPICTQCHCGAPQA